MKQEATKNMRPPFLSALCILTFIGSTIGFTGYFLLSVFYSNVIQLIYEFSSLHAIEAFSPFYFVMLMVVYALSLIAAIRMWKFHIDGFVIYIIAQTAILVIPVLWLNWNAFSIVNAIFTLVFIAGYSLNLKWMQ